MKKGWIIAFCCLILLLVGVSLLPAGTVTKGLLGKEDAALWYQTDSAQSYTRSTSQGYSMTLHKLDWVGVDVCQVYGGGVNRTDTVISTALTAIGTTAKRAIWLSPGTWVIDANLDASTYTNVTWVIPPGADLAISTGVTLTIGGPIQAGPYQIASGDGTLTYNQTGPVKAFPQWWNATAVSNASVSTSGTGEDTLATSTVTRGLMGTVGGLHVVASGTKTGTNDNKTIGFYFSTSSMTVGVPLNNAHEWRFEAWIWNTSASAQRVIWNYQDGMTGGLMTFNQGYEALSVATTADVTMKMTGECANASDTITQTMWFWERI